MIAFTRAGITSERYHGRNTIAETPTGWLWVTCSGSSVTVHAQIDVVFELAGKTSLISQAKREELVGSWRPDPSVAVQSTIGRIAIWFGAGLLAGEAARGAEQLLIESALQYSPEVRRRMAELFPRWAAEVER